MAFSGPCIFKLSIFILLFYLIDMVQVPSILDTTISETISENQASHIQAAVDILASRATVDRFQLNETKCKELLVNFNVKNSTFFEPVVVNGMPIDLVTSAKILDLNLSNDLKWNCHIDFIIKKAKKRLYGVSQLKRPGLGPRELVQLFRTCIRPITEYAWPVFHDGLPVYLSNELECVLKRSMRGYFPLCSYNEAFVKSGLTKLSDRRQELVEKLF